MRQVSAPPTGAVVLRRVAAIPPGLITSVVSLSVVAVVGVQAGDWNAIYAMLFFAAVWSTWARRQELHRPAARWLILMLLVVAMPVVASPLPDAASLVLSSLPLFMVLAILTHERPLLHRFVFKAYVVVLPATIFAASNWGG